MTFLALLHLSLSTAAQTVGLHLPLDPAVFVSWALKGLATLLGGVFLVMLKSAVQSFNSFKAEMGTRLDTIDASISQVQSDVQTTKQELFGVSGSNGIRGELREIKADATKVREISEAHEVLLARLADKAGLPFKGHSR